MATGSSTAHGRHRLDLNETVFELAAHRAGLRTELVLYRDGEAVAEGRGVGRVMLPVPPAPSDAHEPGPDPDERKPPTVLAIAITPGTITRAFLLIPRPSAESEDTASEKAPQDEGAAHEGTAQGERAARDEGAAQGEKGEEGEKGAAGVGRSGRELDEALAELPEGLAKLVGFARAERHLFEPPPGTLAARLLAFQREHPKLYASRHVVLATGRVLLGLLGLAVFFQLILSSVIQWIVEHLPDMDLPRLPLPDLDLPSIPWPDIPLPDLPDVALPPWLAVILATAKYWIPILIAIGVAVQEVRKRRKQSAASSRSLAEPDEPADRAENTADPAEERMRRGDDAAEPAGETAGCAEEVMRRTGGAAESAEERMRRAGDAGGPIGGIAGPTGEAGGERAPVGAGQDGADTRRTGDDRQPDAHR
jgi:hypothetical protein